MMTSDNRTVTTTIGWLAAASDWSETRAVRSEVVDPNRRRW